MGRRWARSILAGVLTVAAGVVLVPGGVARAGDLENAAAFLLNDSPTYVFGSGIEPTRNAPVAVASLSADGFRSGTELEFRQLARFVPDDEPVTARVTFYGRRGKPAIAGGVEFPFTTGSGTVETTLVERETEGTPTTPEVWEAADEDFGDARGEYTPEGGTLRITAKGDYLRLLRDPWTAVGIDLFLGAPGTAVQASARVSIGDLTGARPGLVARQGTGVGEDGTPRPWITLAYAGEFSRFRLAATLDPPNDATVDVGKLGDSAQQIRLFTANPFTPVPTGMTFEGYELMLFAPTDASVRALSGDAFDAFEVGPVEITPGKRKGRFGLEFAEQIRGTHAAVQAVVPAQSVYVLLATSFHARF